VVHLAAETEDIHQKASTVQQEEVREIEVQPLEPVKTTDMSSAP
jgi:hypothetical protein